MGFISNEIVGNLGMSNFSGMMDFTKQAEVDWGKKLRGEEAEKINVTTRRNSPVKGRSKNGYWPRSTRKNSTNKLRHKVFLIDFGIKNAG